MPKNKSKNKYEIKFPHNFMWGTAMSAHQVEGQNIFNDWWEWEQKGKILNRQISGDACNHYKLYKKDFELMKTMHHNMHRLSIEWSRVEPKEGEFNRYEIRHYRDVLKNLRKQGIEPMVTLFHFTLPYWFYKKGGFLNPNGRQIFNRFVKRIVNELGDLVTYWITINEPFVYANFSYWEGLWPPGDRNVFKTLKVIRKLLYVHMDAYHTIKEIYRNKGWKKSQVGFAKSFIWFDPYKKSSLLSNILSEAYRFFYNKVYFKPFYSGKIPLILGGGRIKEIKETLDFIGMNYYFRCTCHYNPLKSPLHFRSQYSAEIERSHFNWEVFPDGLYYLSKLIYRKLKKPIIVTENGISTHDDAQRISYIVRHLDAINRAMSEGVDIQGYLYWSFIDNFEWAEGFTQPFGLLAMNPRTFERIPKSSAQVYSEICKTGKVTDQMIKKYAKNIRDRILKK